MNAAAPGAAAPLEALVTGAAGFIGGHTVSALLDAGWAVTALDVSECPPWMASAVGVVRAEADDPQTLNDVRDGRYAAVIHQGAISSTLADDWDRLSEVNVRQPLALAEAAAVGRARFVYASSHSVYGTIRRRVAVTEAQATDASVCTGPLNLYARSKLVLDQEMVRRYAKAPQWFALRYTNVFGKGEEHKGAMASIISQLLRSAAEGRQLRVFADTLNACRDYIPVENVARTVVRLAGQDTAGGIYNLGSASPVSFATLLHWCADLSTADALDVRLVRNPIPDRYQYWTCADQSRLETALPGAGPVPIDEVKAAAARLFTHFHARALDGIHA